MTFILLESERAKDGDGFDQVGNNPCNSMSFYKLILETLL